MGAVYHAITRGDNRKNVFEGEHEKYLGIIKRCKELYGFKIYSYCEVVGTVRDESKKVDIIGLGTQLHVL